MKTKQPNKNKKPATKKVSDKQIIEMSNLLAQRNLDVYKDLAK